MLNYFQHFEDDICNILMYHMILYILYILNYLKILKTRVPFRLYYVDGHNRPEFSSSFALIRTFLAYPSSTCELDNHNRPALLLVYRF
jgi:hypothetical protein